MKRKKNTGFTLVEILVAISVAIIAGSILITIFVQSNGIFLQQNAQVGQGLSLNNSISEINNSIIQSSSIAPVYPTSGTPQFTTSPHTLVLALPSIDSSGGIISNTYDYVIISADTQKPKVLRKLLNPDPSSFRKSENKVLATNLSEITFYLLDNSGNNTGVATTEKINYYINLSEPAGKASKVSTASSQVNLKNR